VKPNDFLRRVRRFASRLGCSLEIVEGGNHTKIRLQGRSSVIPRHAKDLPTGTQRAILKQLVITLSDLED
jgi:hypothetical protein